MSPDESYYWVWGKNLQLSYFDHPPLIAWLFFLASPFDAYGGLVRLPAILLGHCSWLVWHEILRPATTPVQRIWFLALALASPLLGLGGLIAVPDLPLLFFWSLALLCFLRGLQTDSIFWYASLGVSLGLGFLSKYHIVLFLPSLFVALLASGRMRDVRWAFVPVTLLVGLILSVPVLIWNWQNDFASFAFQLQRGIGRGFRWQWPVEYVLGQVLIIFPPILALAGQTVVRSAATSPLIRILAAMAMVPMTLFFLSSFGGRVEANWTGVALPAFLALAVLSPQQGRWLAWTLGLWIVVFLVVLSQALFEWMPIDKRRLKTHGLRRFDTLVDATKQFRPLYASSYQMAASLSFRSQLPIPKLAGSRRMDFYDFLPTSRPTSQRFFFARGVGDPLPAWLDSTPHALRVVSTTSCKDFEVVEVSLIPTNPTPNP